ncbi:hypothetical protein [Methylomonas sp. LL1]|uniref:hypothetical protein n=1 Tax=Methylomonas sp. LL1 TaxID=2785785 RepID=UPI0018C40CBC|nr:hypothetical protein [Methylomonas sp. LL1]
MKNSYIFIYNRSLGTKEEVRDFVNSCESIITWRSELSNTFFIVSELSAYKIYDLVAEYFGEGKGEFLICKYDENNSQGLLNERSWHLLNNNELPPKEKTNS